MSPLASQVSAIVTLMLCTCVQTLPTHSNFLRARYYNGGRWSFVSCANDASVCQNRLKNPAGGSTCCWNKLCKDLSHDISNCGRCGHSCSYGLSCCKGSCVDLKSDNRNCGECGAQCPGGEKCAFGMCDYGYTYRVDLHRDPKH